MHGWTKRETGFKAALRRTFYRLADGFLLYGHHAKCIGIEEGFKPEKMYVIYNSLDYTAQIRARNKVTEEQISHLRSELFAQPDCPMLICTSRLTKVRRLDLLLNAMKILQEEGLATNLLLVGDGPEKEALQRLSSELGVSVHFFGECYDEDKIAELTMAAAITVAPGKVGLTAMHSLAYGTPVITHDDFEDQMPEWEAIIPGKSGGFFRRDDVADLARAIENWLRLGLPNQEVRQNCFALIDRFYNPIFQRIAIDRAVDGKIADDLFWLHDSQDFPKIHPQD
jgi:glycosyltransferase involved in cell wall biosynthesis